MKLHVEGNLYVESDERQYIVREYLGTFDKEGRENQKTPHHFKTFGGVLRYLLNKELRATTATTLFELLKEFERIETKLTEVGEDGRKILL